MLQSFLVNSSSPQQHHASSSHDLLSLETSQSSERAFAHVQQSPTKKEIVLSRNSPSAQGYDTDHASDAESFAAGETGWGPGASPEVGKVSLSSSQPSGSVKIMKAASKKEQFFTTIVIKS